MTENTKWRTCIRCRQLTALKNSRWYIEAWLCFDCYADTMKKKNKDGISSVFKNKP